MKKRKKRRTKGKGNPRMMSLRRATMRDIARLLKRELEASGEKVAAGFCMKAVSAMTDAMISVLRRGDAIALKGFGTIYHRLHMPKRVVSPWTGAPSHKLPHRTALWYEPGRRVKAFMKETDDLLRREGRLPSDESIQD